MESTPADDGPAAAPVVAAASEGADVAPAAAAPVSPPVSGEDAAAVPAEGGVASAAPLAPAMASPVAAPMAAVAAAVSPAIKKDGKPEGGGPVSNPLALRHERLQGTISKYVPSSGWGFVKSHLFEGELGFKTESIMQECQNHDFKEEEAVEFDVQSDEKGRPHAVALKPMTGKKPSECIGQRHRGYVRRFADRWGFLNSAAFDGDLFVHRDNLLLSPEQFQDGQPPLRTGQAVEFDVALDDRGRTVAKQITTSALPRPCDWIGRRMTGYIRSFQGAWGFINSDRFAGDLFIHSDSVLHQYQGIELTVGTMVEFDVERDHHRKGGKNRLVARQVAILHQPNTMQHHQAAMSYGMMPQHFPQGGYSSGLNPGAATFAPMQSAMYYPGAAQPMAGTLPPDQGQNPLGHLGYQPPYPYADLQYGAQPGMPPAPVAPLPQPGGLPQYGQPMVTPGTSPYAQLPHHQPLPQAQHLTAPTQPGMPGQSPYAGVMTQPAYGLPQQLPGAAGAGQPPVGVLQQPGPAGIAPDLAARPVEYGAAAAPAPVPAASGAGSDGAVAAAGGAEQPQVLLHITTHDWEPDQSGQLRVRKGTLINVSHRAAHGWVYATTVQAGGDVGEPVAEGWVPQAVAKRVSLCRVVVDWPAEGSGTLGLSKGDLIAVSKEAERGWVYGERISPRRPDLHSDGWLPKKVLEYILM